VAESKVELLKKQLVLALSRNEEDMLMLRNTDNKDEDFIQAFDEARASVRQTHPELVDASDPDSLRQQDDADKEATTGTDTNDPDGRASSSQPTANKSKPASNRAMEKAAVLNAKANDIEVRKLNRRIKELEAKLQSALEGSGGNKKAQGLYESHFVIFVLYAFDIAPTHLNGKFIQISFYASSLDLNSFTC
jgi:hypothetical protein